MINNLENIIVIFHQKKIMFIQIGGGLLKMMKRKIMKGIIVNLIIKNKKMNVVKQLIIIMMIMIFLILEMTIITK